MLHFKYCHILTIQNTGSYCILLVSFDLKNLNLIFCNLFSYSFAIVGINLTHLAYSLWKDGSAKTHVYNLCSQQLPVPGPTLVNFHRFYCYLFIEFDKLWMSEKPPTIMEFGRIRNQFESNIRLLLANPNCVFKLNLPVEHV